MQQYKNLGIAAIILNMPSLFIHFAITVFVRPKILEMFESLNVALPLSTKIVPYVSALIIMFSLYGLFTGIKLTQQKEPNESLLKNGKIVTIIAFLLLVFATGFSILSVIGPIYQITTAL